ncbi:hypothetical protein [Shewanella psychromarinicola]|jgi:hypothetical protein|uniref:hypothetical protein n=1 Tax=Shewanella psychromarinicola TaxID=2487742 RepID=UPI003F4B8B25
MQSSRLTHITLVAMLVSSAAISFNAAALPQAPMEDVLSLKGACQQIVLEDQLPENEVATFLLDCVNDQLTEMGYERVASLD